MLTEHIIVIKMNHLANTKKCNQLQVTINVIMTICASFTSLVTMVYSEILYYIPISPEWII